MEVKPILVPDATTRFVLSHQKLALASDRLCVARSTTGLLQSVQFATDDKTGEILVKIAELAAKIAKTAVIGPLDATARGLEEGLPEGTKVTAHAIGDPQDPGSLTKQLQEILGDEISSVEFIDLIPFKNGRRCPEKTICFSTLASVPVILKGTNANKMRFNLTSTVPLVDFGHVGKLRIDRPFLVDQVTKLGFTDGVLTSLAFRRPSEGLGLISLPLDALDAVLAVPANFFSSALSGIFSDQKALLTQQKEIAELQQHVREDSSKNRDGTANTGGSDSNFKLECTPLTVKN